MTTSHRRPHGVPLQFTILSPGLVNTPLPRSMLWLGISHRTVTEDPCWFALEAIPEGGTGDSVFLRLELPDGFHIPSLDMRDEVVPSPAKPDVTINFSTEAVILANTPAAGVVREAISSFPYPKSLRLYTTEHALPYHAVEALLSALVAAWIAPTHGMPSPSALIEGSPLRLHWTALLSVLWMNLVFDYIEDTRHHRHEGELNR